MSDEKELAFALKDFDAESVERSRRALAETVKRAMCTPLAFDAAAFARSLQPAQDFARVAELATAQLLARVGQVCAAWVALAEEMTRQAEQAGIARTASVRAMPEEEREELRRAIEDAPLEPVDVDASELGEM